MSRTSRHFVSLLKVEFEDIKSDLRAMEELLVSRIGLRQIPEAVHPLVTRRLHKVAGFIGAEEVVER
jgi:hypothetical protein